MFGPTVRLVGEAGPSSGDAKENKAVYFPHHVGAGFEDVAGCAPARPAATNVPRVKHNASTSATTKRGLKPSLPRGPLPHDVAARLAIMMLFPSLPSPPRPAVNPASCGELSWRSLFDRMLKVVESKEDSQVRALTEVPC